jgi:hypothetical protein
MSAWRHRLGASRFRASGAFERHVFLSRLLMEHFNVNTICSRESERTGSWEFLLRTWQSYGLPLEFEPSRIFRIRQQPGDFINYTWKVKHVFQQRPQLLLTANGLQVESFHHFCVPKCIGEDLRLRETMFLPRFSLSALTILAQQPLLGRTR